MHFQRVGNRADRHRLRARVLDANDAAYILSVHGCRLADLNGQAPGGRRIRWRVLSNRAGLIEPSRVNAQIALCKG